MKSRKFSKDTLLHCYQRSADGGVLFYDFLDHLVYFTHYCTLAREYDITVLAACHYFESFAAALVATHSTTGSEYDLNEVFVGKSDKPYADMAQILMKECGFKDIHEILALDNDAKRGLFDILRRQTYVMAEQIAKFLHLPIIKV